jgi:4-amino-4-deoxy-L-arabinose transferase-like glycosyltransferase
MDVVAPEGRERPPGEERTPLGPLLIVWGGIALVAFVVRALYLDRAALSPLEARYAFAAWEASRGVLDGSLSGFGAPLLSYLTTLFFFLFGANDVTARLVSTLAGVGLALTPALLTATLGLRTSLLAGALLALSPIAVQLARVSDTASLSALVVMLLVASAIRLLTDRPTWSPWVLAISGGLALATASETIVALLAAAIAAVSTWSMSRARLREWLATALGPGGRPFLLTALLTAAVAVTAGFMELRGVGFVLGDIWAGVLRVLTPAPIPSRNFASLLVYGAVPLALAGFGFVRGVRSGDRLALFLGQWTLLLIVVAVAFGQGVLAFALFPVAPICLLAGQVLAALTVNWAPQRLSGSSWLIIGLTIVLGGVAILSTARAVGDARATPAIAVAVVLITGLLVAFLWKQETPPEERVPALLTLGVGLFLLMTIGTIGRLSFGGSPPGSELLVRQQTAPELRARFDDLMIQSIGDARRVLLFDAATPIEVRWYGRNLPQAMMVRGPGDVPWTVREAPPPDAGTPRAVTGRMPWTTISRLDREDLHPLGVLQWLITRKGLVEGQSRDIVVAQ